MRIFELYKSNQCWNAIVFISMTFAVSTTRSDESTNNKKTITSPSSPTDPSQKVGIAIPQTNSKDEWREFVAKAKQSKPTTPEQYRQMQESIKTGSKRILEIEKDRSSSTYRTAEFDFISSSVMLIANEGPDAQQKTSARFIEYLKAKPALEPKDLQIALLAGQNMEQLEDKHFAKEVYQAFASVLEEKKDESLSVWIEMMKANAKRVDLVGNEFIVEGKSLNGQEFNSQSLRGKFTLVYFWASWNRACIDEYQPIKEFYEQNREKGFEIVAFSVDEDREQLDQFVKEKKIPWLQLWDESNKSAPKVIRDYGISAIPTMILLDREGKVLSIDARGLLLGNMLRELLNAPTQKLQSMISP